MRLDNLFTIEGFHQDPKSILEEGVRFGRREQQMVWDNANKIRVGVEYEFHPRRESFSDPDTDSIDIDDFVNKVHDMMVSHLEEYTNENTKLSRSMDMFSISRNTARAIDDFIIKDVTAITEEDFNEKYRDMVKDLTKFSNYDDPIHRKAMDSIREYIEDLEDSGIETLLNDAMISLINDKIEFLHPFGHFKKIAQTSKRFLKLLKEKWFEWDDDGISGLEDIKELLVAFTYDDKTIERELGQQGNRFFGVFNMPPIIKVLDAFLRHQNDRLELIVREAIEKTSSPTEDFVGSEPIDHDFQRGIFARISDDIDNVIIPNMSGSVHEFGNIIDDVEDDMQNMNIPLFKPVHEDNDEQVEVATNHKPLDEALETMKTMLMYIQTKGYTSDRSGMHVNISYNGQQINKPLKYLLLMDNDYIETYYPGRGHTGNALTGIVNNLADRRKESLFGNILLKVFDESPSNYDVLNFIIESAENVSMEKNSDIHKLMNYIENRFFGGDDYEHDYDKHEYHIIRSAYHMMILFDPEIGEREYMKQQVLLADRIIEEAFGEFGIRDISGLTKAMNAFIADEGSVTNNPLRAGAEFSQYLVDK